MQKAAVLTEALPYIQDFSGSTVLVKVGGSVMENEENLVSLLSDISFMDAVGMRVVLVHGGGKAISKALKESGLVPQFVEGLRVTDEPTMEIVRHTLNNVVNADLVKKLQAFQTNARPLHGNWMFTAEKITSPDRGYVGEPVAVDTRAVREMLDAGIVPVVTPLGTGRDGHLYNVNADSAAAALAKALKVRKFAVVSDVPGARSAPGSVRPLDAPADAPPLQRRETKGGGSDRGRHAAQDRRLRGRDPRRCAQGPPCGRPDAALAVVGNIHPGRGGNGDHRMSKSEEIAEIYKQYMMPTYAPSVVLDKAKGSRVFGVDGTQYYDLTSGIGVHNIGHCHPEVVKAIQSQVEVLGHCSNLFMHEGQALLAKKLVELSGLGGKVFFCNSGAEANEAAIKLARKWGSANGGRYEIVTMRNSFHGRTLATITATGQDWCQQGYEPLPVGFAYADFNDIESVKAAVTDKTVAVMLEAVQGEGGVNPATEEFMAGVRALCDEKNLIMICDEVQCGMGRTGKWWGWQNYSVQPDLFTVAKSIADGIPMGALVSNEKFADVFTVGSHASTFGGNPVACAAALATIGVIEKYDLLGAAAKKGEMLKAALESFAEKYDQILDVRGLGLMLGMVTEGPAKDVVQAFADGGVLTCTAGEHVVRFLPTLSMKDSHLEEAVEMMGETLDELFGVAE